MSGFSVPSRERLVVERYDIPLSFFQSSSTFLLLEHFSLVLFLTTAWSHLSGFVSLGYYERTVLSSYILVLNLKYHCIYQTSHFSLPHLTSLFSEADKTNSGAHKPSKPTANLTPLPAPPRPRIGKYRPLFSPSTRRWALRHDDV